MNIETARKKLDLTWPSPRAISCVLLNGFWFHMTETSVGWSLLTSRRDAA